jgi:DNA modification methylase
VAEGQAEDTGVSVQLPTADEPVVLIQGDCLDVLRQLPDGCVDAVVTDPPYEGMKGGTVIDHPGVAERRKTSRTVGAELGNAAALSECRRLCRRGAIVFCSYHWVERCLEMTGGKRRGLVSWFKRNSPYSVNNSPWFQTEYAWAVQYGPGIDWRNLRTHIDAPMLQAGCMADERICDDGKASHPAQKPLQVMRALLCPGMDVVLDPYMGTGTTGVACVQTGRRFIGVEIDPGYFAIAQRRINEALGVGGLFQSKPAAAELFT